MSAEPPLGYLVGLVRELCRLPRETEWVEWKHNDGKPDEIGEYISALANSAALLGKANAYLVWGIDDATHELLGTTFVPGATKVGNEELENWLLRLLTPKLGFRFFEVMVDGKAIIVLEIERAFRHPVQFQGQEYIRVGSYKKKLKDHPEKERELWRTFDHTPFENRLALEHLDAQAVLRLLDYPAYFDLLQRPLPDGTDAILASLFADGLVGKDGAGGLVITNLGAVLLAKRLADFPGLGRKAVRIVRYAGTSRATAAQEHVEQKGFASGFQDLIDRIQGVLPPNEAIERAIRKSVPMYPDIAIRELVANALIHQDFFITGQGPMIEVFLDRIEITNPGASLVVAERFLDAPPRSRNEKLASLMRRFGICEERGSGIDKVVFHIEVFQLPAPLFEVAGEATRAVLLSPRPLKDLDRVDRVRACYQHACLRYVDRGYLTNESLRARFGIAKGNSAVASRLIKESIEAGVIVPHEDGVAPKLRKYVPAWAKAAAVARSGT
ncbi:MAG: RNA-binding domain-containing protein [Planctomycetota bacterium]